MSGPGKHNPVWRLAWTAVFLALAAASGIGFLAVFAPEAWPEPLKPFEAYDPRAMDAAMSPNSVQAGLEKILALGPRFLGDEGLVRTERHIRAALESAGLKAVSRRLRAAAPRTEQRRIVGPDGKPLAGVEIYPFFPNHFQPMVTPAEGLAGLLVLATDEVLKTRPRFDDAIALIDANAPPREFAFAWTRYAQIGFRAVIVAHRGGLSKIDWSRTVGWNQMVSTTPANYVRLAANGRIFEHAGKTVRLHVRQAYRNVPNATIVGVLRGSGQANEALVICAPYDSCSLLPDHAPGTMQAVGTAAQLALLKALTGYRASLRRDVIFVAHGSRMMGHDGMVRLLSVLGPSRVKGTALLDLRRRIEDHRRTAASIDALLRCLDRDGFFTDAGASREILAGLDPHAAGLFAEQLTYVLNSLVFDLSEAQLRAKIVFLHDETEDLEGQPFRHYLAAKGRCNEAMTVAGYPFEKLLSVKGGFLRRLAVAERFGKRLRELRVFHGEEIAQLQGAVAIKQALSPYKTLVVLTPALLPGEDAGEEESVTFYMGEGVDHDYQGPVINSVLESLVQRRDVPAGLKLVPLARGHGDRIKLRIHQLPQDVRYWGQFGYPGLALVSLGRLSAYQAYGWPVELPYMRDLRSLRRSLWLLGRTALSLAHGNGAFKPPKVGYTRGVSFGGQVLASGVGSSTVPNYPLAGAMVGNKGATGSFERVGYYLHPMIFADPYGRYGRSTCTGGWWIPWYDGSYSPNAVRFGADGLIAHIKDEGPLGQDIYKSMNISTWHQETDRVNIVTFRASAVTILDLINPQTVKAYTGVDFVTREGLNSLKRFNRFDKANDMITTFVEPDRRFYVRLKAGGADNELVQETRAFILGVGEGGARSRGDREIDGPGYLAGDVPLLRDVPRRIAGSMIDVNGRRLRLQGRYDMADRRTQAFHAKGEEFLARSREPNQPYRQSELLARDAVAYATLNHPVLRRTVSEAVVSIVWYLCLLVPFVFFFEKLLFGLPDIRKQLAVQGVTFLVVFGLLWWLHPAFQMIRSSLMILLGFVILLISGGITVLFAGKFQENLEQLKARRGVVTAAGINAMGVIGTAFMLGLNNMHRRRLRTLLTCATLVLITFAMICFTSIHSDLVDTAVALGKASYQGVLFRKDDVLPIEDAELFALQSRYGEQFRVASRMAWVGLQTWSRQQFNPELEIVHKAPGSAGRKVAFDSICQFDPHEPLADRVRFVTKTGWFDPNSARVGGKDIPILIPQAMAEELGLTAAAVDAGGVVVEINGRPLTVRGIFDHQTFARVQDLNGYNLLPFNVAGMTNLRKDKNWNVLADEESDPRIGADRIVLAPNGDLGIQASYAVRRRLSVAIWMPDLRYKEARGQIETILEKSGRRMHYGLDGMAYVGQRARQSTFAGLLDLAIPLVLAALTVLNTMRGSVYERRDEIFVYNAVGIAPRYVFFMFFAEAFVYAVVGAVAGFLLSQSAGRIMTALNFTGGLNMSFTSVSTIYTSLAIAAAVFASTYFPARSAMQIAAPAEEAGWELPAPDGDEMHFLLPFTFSPRDRIAVLAFFHRYLADHGEGSAGGFFSDPPRLGLSGEPDSLADGAYVPQVATTIWLKPFDLGVSQELCIDLRTDEETGEFIARVTLRRLAGTRESWVRLNRPFIQRVRRQFLHWRAVVAEQREEMFQEGRKLLTEAVAGPEAAHV